VTDHHQIGFDFCGILPDHRCGLAHADDAIDLQPGVLEALDAFLEDAAGAGAIFVEAVFGHHYLRILGFPWHRHHGEQVAARPHESGELDSFGQGRLPFGAAVVGEHDGTVSHDAS